MVDLLSRDEYRNFELEFEWSVSPAADSGVMFRVSEEWPQPYCTGPEMQIIDDVERADGKRPETSACSLFGLIPPANKHLNPAGAWNKTRILVNGNHVEYWANDEKVVEYELGSVSLKGLLGANSFYRDKPEWGKLASGHIDFQNYVGEVCYRNIRIRRLP